MPVIKVETHINAPVTIVFDLSRSIDLHKLSAASTNEEAVAGKTSGLIGKGEFVTWRAKHLGVRQELTSMITAYDRPDYFVDEMTKGIFKSIVHHHHFLSTNNGTTMQDIFIYESPFGILGKLINKIFLTDYLHDFLIKRNNIIKEFAENPERYKKLLPL